MALVLLRLNHTSVQSATHNTPPTLEGRGSMKYVSWSTFSTDHSPGVRSWSLRLSVKVFRVRPLPVWGGAGRGGEGRLTVLDCSVGLLLAKSYLRHVGQCGVVVP